MHTYMHIYITKVQTFTCTSAFHLFNSSIHTFNDSCLSFILLSLGPTPDIILTSSTLRLPIHPDYNQATLICTATLPLPPETDELVLDKVFTWTMNGINVTSEASLPTDLDSIESMSTLTQELTNTGDNVFRCEVNVSVPGDPIVSNSSSITITVSGK